MAGLNSFLNALSAKKYIELFMYNNQRNYLMQNYFNQHNVVTISFARLKTLLREFHKSMLRLRQRS